MIDFRRPLTRNLTLAVFILLAGFMAWRASGIAARLVHTRFLFTQLEEGYQRYLAGGGPPATTENAFLNLLPGWKIDWNSCRLQEKAIYDAWGNPVQTNFTPDAIILLSAGPDRLFQTSDDLTQNIAGKTKPSSP